jgi:pyruvate dehydrogenase E1 component alpha subunit
MEIGQLPAETLFGLYERMKLCRRFEEHLHRAVQMGELAGFVHLSAGQEAVAVGVCWNLRTDDWIASNHRGHGHLIAKGMSITTMMAEIYGRASGASKGIGGSMHMADPSVGVLGTNGIVGAGLPLANGPALSAKVRGTDQVSVCFFGDGASNQGTFNEALNFAAVFDLPTVFVLENNLYGETSSVEYTHRVDRISTRAAGFGIPGQTVDGMDVLKVLAAAAEAVARARAGRGPTLLECRTYRYYGHYEGDPDNYRSAAEIAAYREKDPIEVLKAHILRGSFGDPEELRRIEEKVDREIKKAVAHAKASPQPDPAEYRSGVFSGGGE